MDEQADSIEAPNLGPDWGKVHGRDPFQCSDCERLKDTVRRLNRRCQLAEAAANIKVEEYGKRSKPHGHSYIFALGKRSAFSSPDDRQALQRWVTEGLQTYVAAHGQSLEHSGIGSAAKRIVGVICARLTESLMSVGAVDPQADASDV